MRHNDYKDFSYQITSIEKFNGGEKFRVSVQIPKKIGWIERMKFSVTTCGQKRVFQLKHLKNDDKFVYFQTEVELVNSALYHYYFSFEANGSFQYYKKINKTGNTSLTTEECWQMSVGFHTPDWAKGAVMYHIFVDRFRKGRNKNLVPMVRRTVHKNWYEPPVLGPDENGHWNIDFYGGDLKGIEDSLSYIKSLGVSIIYLSPIVRSQSNHRYDTADYEEVDPYVGTNDELKKLCDAAHKKNMYVVLDAVFNHTGNDSKYFNQYGTYDSVGAYQSEKSPYYSFYKRKWNNGTKSFGYWWGMTNLPECDGDSPTWQNYILGKGGIIDQWFELGIDGLRLDVADELTDYFIEKIRVAVHRNKTDGFILGEVWKNPMRMNRGYISSGKGMDSVMNYPLADALIRYYKYSDVLKLSTVMKEMLTEYPKETLYTLMNFTSTHDISRLIEILGCDIFQKYGEWAWNLLNDSLEWIRNHKMTSVEYKYGKCKLKSFIFVLTFWPGILSIFYGDEAGMRGAGNLENRAGYPWKRRDKDLVNFFRKMGKNRKKYDFLKTAETDVLKIDENQIMYERYDDENRILVIASRTHHHTAVELPEEYKNAEIICKLKGCNKVALVPYGAIALKI